MVAVEQRQHLTVDEWRALLASGECKYEYIDGWVYAMAGGTLTHARISLNAARALEDALGNGPCQVYTSDAAVRLSEERYVFPDVTVTCHSADQGKQTEIEAPRVVVEVLSESTERYDRGKKFRYYQACPTIEEYVVIATEYQSVEVFRRSRQDWTYHAYGPDDTVELASIGVRLPVPALYRRTEVPRTPDEADSAETPPR